MPFESDKLGVLVQQGGIIGILVVIIVAAATKRIVFWWQYADLQKQVERLRQEIIELRLRIENLTHDRDDWRAMAHNATGVARTGKHVAGRAERVVSTSAELLARLEAAEDALKLRGWQGGA